MIDLSINPRPAQLELPLTAPPAVPVSSNPRRVALERLLASDLDFKGQDSGYASHNFHAFAAKFPPQLPRGFIRELTEVGETVLDPMMGSGTAVLEAFLLGRKGIGCDLDPLAVHQARVKTTWIDPTALERQAEPLLARAGEVLRTLGEPAPLLRERYACSSAEFIEYWFAPETQRQLLALVTAIEELPAGPERDFFELAFSSVIITKSGGVSLARDLAHSRPHRANDKTPRDAVAQFAARVRKNTTSLSLLPRDGPLLEIRQADARELPLPGASVDLVVTSPPYANAIDYMRAHKFALVWFGRPMEELTELRSRYIGSERTVDISRPSPDRRPDTGAGWNPRPTARGRPVDAADGRLPKPVEGIIARVAAADRGKARVLRKYHVEMRRAIREMNRVLLGGRACIIVVGSSTMRGIDVETQTCLAGLARECGFEVVGVAERQLDRDRRMMPARLGSRGSLIEERMHHEYVIGCLKPG